MFSGSAYTISGVRRSGDKLQFEDTWLVFDVEVLRLVEQGQSGGEVSGGLLYSSLTPLAAAGGFCSLYIRR